LFQRIIISKAVSLARLIAHVDFSSYLREINSFSKQRLNAFTLSPKTTEQALRGLLWDSSSFPRYELKNIFKKPICLVFYLILNDCLNRQNYTFA